MDLDYRLIFHVKKIVSDEESGEFNGLRGSHVLPA